jgi:hypothetical protein
MNTDATITSHSAANDAALIAQCNEWQELFPRPAVSDAEFRSAAYSRRLDCMSALQISIAGTEATSEAGRTGWLGSGGASQRKTPSTRPFGIVCQVNPLMPTCSP